MRDAAMQDLFDRWRVVPHTVVYEDLIAAYEPMMRRLVEFLEIPGRHSLTIPAPAFEQLADRT
jgi:trehalose 2-sulfotransferase